MKNISILLLIILVLGMAYWVLSPEKVKDKIEEGTSSVIESAESVKKDLGWKLEEIRTKDKLEKYKEGEN